MEVLGHGAHKRFCRRRHDNVPLQDRFEGVVGTVVEGGGVVDVLRDVIAGEIDARKQTLGTRIGQQLGVQLPIRAGLRVATDGTG